MTCVGNLPPLSQESFFFYHYTVLTLEDYVDFSVVNPEAVGTEIGLIDLDPHSIQQQIQIQSYNIMTTPVDLIINKVEENLFIDVTKIVLDVQLLTHLRGKL